MKEFIIKRLKSLQYVFQGISYLVKNEPPVIVHIVISLLWIGAGFYFEISTQEWIIELLCIGLVLSIEALNTAVEKVCDFVHPERAKEIGIIKDIAAGAVGFAVIPVTIVLGIIYYPYILKLF
ncbi:diacylglycerol kinase family protein [Capnocytophaga bilenii]|uniref:diacylglycerol kinase family protein n=1 Tax=Capnocytophaga bilenii TaxID=2819369 RepID=UPI0028D38980|nr:diacylglycerol kinase family protein [Capnocytophaga bilenii]